MIDLKEKIKLEEQFINILLYNKDLVADWLDSGLSSKYFDEVHSVILNGIKYAFNSDVLLTRNTFLSFLKKNIKNKLEIQAQENTFIKIGMSNVKTDDYPELKNRILEAHIERRTLKDIEEYEKNTSIKGGLAAARELSKKLSELVEQDIESKKVIYESVSSYAKDFIKELKEDSEKKEDTTIKCHIKEIDETLGKGFTPGSLIMFCSDVGGYKTTMLLNIVRNIFTMSHKNVLYIPLEMPKKSMFQKLIALDEKIPFSFFEHPKLLSKGQWEMINAFPKKLNKIEEENHCQFYMMEAPEQVSVSFIRREIEKHIETFRPDVVVVDYIANLIPDENTYRKDRNDLEIGSMLKYLRTIGKPGAVHDGGFSVVSAAQVGREGLKRYRKSGAKGTFYSEDIHGSHQYPADADAMYVQMKMDQQNDNTRLKFICLKNRYGPTNFSNGSNSTILEVRPDIGLIRSMNTCLFDNNIQKDIMSKVDDPSSFEDNKKDNAPENIDDLLLGMTL